MTPMSARGAVFMFARGVAVRGCTEGVHRVCGGCVERLCEKGQGARSLYRRAATGFVNAYASTTRVEASCALSRAMAISSPGVDIKVRAVRARVRGCARDRAGGRGIPG